MKLPEAELVEKRVAPLPPSGMPPQPRSGVAAAVPATLAVVAALWWGQRFLIPAAPAPWRAVLRDKAHPACAA